MHVVPGEQGALTRRLHQKAQYIPSDERFREPLLSDDRVVFSIDEQNDAAELHVYRCGEQSGCDQQKHSLYNKRAKGPVRSLGA